jgi:hypothetical protein
MLLDEAACTKNRIATAVDFWSIEDRSPFQEAAVQDGMDAAAPLDPCNYFSPPLPKSLCRRAWLRPLLACLILLALSFLPGPPSLNRGEAGPGTEGILASGPHAAIPQEEFTDRNGLETPLVSTGPDSAGAREQDKEDKGDEAAGRGGQAGTAQVTARQQIPGGAGKGVHPGKGGEKSGKLPSGEPRETKQSRTGTSDGTAGSKGSPAGGAGKPNPEKKTDPKKKTTPKMGSQVAARSQQPQDSNLAAGAMAAGTSRMGGAFAPVTHPWKSEETGGEEDVGGDDEDQEVEEEKRQSRQRGGMQPSMRDRRPPPSRDLSLSQPGDEPGKGRGGPTPPKKSRGTAAMILGLPVPDTVKGLPNPGTSRVEQERTGPKAAPEKPGQGSAPVMGDKSESPMPAGRAAGSEAAIIERYFKRLRGQDKAAPGGDSR